MVSLSSEEFFTLLVSVVNACTVLLDIFTRLVRVFVCEHLSVRVKERAAFIIRDKNGPPSYFWPCAGLMVL